MASINLMLQQNTLFQTYIQQQNVAIANSNIVFQQVNNINQAQTKLNKTMDDSTKKANALMGIFNGPALGKLAKAGSAILGNMFKEGTDQQSVLDQMSLRAGSSGAGQTIFDQTATQALKYGQDVKTALAGTQGFMASTTDPAQLEQLNMLAMRMSQLNPDKGLKGAADALSKLMTGDSKSLGEDYKFEAGDQAALSTASNSGDINGMIAAMDTLLNKQGITQAAFDTMLDSPAVKWKSVVDGFNFQLASLGQQGMNALTPAIDALLSMLNSEAFSQFMSGVGAAFSLVGSLLGEAMAGVASFIGSLTSGGSSTNMLLIGMGVALAAMGVILWAMVAPVVAQAIAWLGVYWPILLVVAVIGLIIGALIKFGVSAESIVGFVVGLFYGLYAAIYNYVAICVNLWITLAEFLINTFHNSVYRIRKFIFDMGQFFGEHMYKMLLAAEDFASGFVSIILDAVNGALRGINLLIKGFNKLTNSDISAISLLDKPDMHMLSDKLRVKLDSMEAPEAPGDSVQLGRMETKDILGAFNQGNQAGKNLVSKGTDFLDSAKSKLDNNREEMLPGSPGTEDAAQLGTQLRTQPGMNISQIGSVGHVGSVDRINETVDISSEDLKMMRELAEVTAIQNFTTLTPTVTVNTGPVSKEVDIHTIVTQIEQVLEEEIATSAAGVYA
ncbi:phage tail tape measure protein [Paenibacillus antibioticophila]|uniref:hypothetical protein n=1 Tax=Paenibacillus antibioticophila TaxID=1274374 RepID=UPI0005CA0A1B|nr:hypothetical protein [Paenibacillus antibioticophila]